MHDDKFTSTSSRNCKQTGDLKRGIRGRLRSSSPLVTLLDKRVFKFKVCIFKREICYFANFKIPLVRKNWLLKFGFTYRLAQILEPKLLVHEILKFVWYLLVLIKQIYKFENFTHSPWQLTKFRSVICLSINFKIWRRFLIVYNIR